MVFNFSSPILGWFVFGIFFVWLGSISFFVFKMSRFFSDFSKKSKTGDIKEYLSNLKKEIEEEERERKKLKYEIDELKKKSRKNFQKFSFMRFNPFSETGGDQSFSVALLDGEDSGIVMSSLHSRNQTRLYAKEIKRGSAGKYELSDEEKEILKNVVKKV